MSKYTLEVEELQKAVALLTHVDSKLDVLSKRITAAYHRLDNQQGSAIEKAQSDIYYQGSIYDEQWNYIKYIKTILQTILDESLKAETEAKKIMESEWVEESKKEENKGTVTKPETGGVTEIGITGNEFLKKFQNSEIYNWSSYGNGVIEDYSNYYVIKKFDVSYCMHQKYYEENVLGTWGACTVTADCIAGSIKRGYKVEPTRKDINSDGAARWTYTKKVPNTQYSTIQNQLKHIYINLTEGNPVVMRVDGNGIGHSVTAIGLRQGVTLETMTPKDILIVDPGDGKIKNADQVFEGWTVNSRKLSMQNGINYSLRIPK